MSALYLDSETNSTDTSGSDSELPYPTPLPRSDFLKPDYSALSYLSSLKNRHQSLEDLRIDLRERNSQISKELSDFINAQYEDFTSLGNSLDGAEEKLEEVTFALMGFRRDAENVVRTITQEDNHLVQLLNERKKINDEIQGGRDLLLFHAALSEAEALVIPTTSDGQQPCPAWEGLDVETDEIGGLEVRDTKPRQTGPQKAEDPLHDRVQQFLYASKLAAKIDPAHPFLESRLPKLAEIKKLVLADLRDGLVTACNAETRDEAQILKQLSSYKDLQETREAITILNDIAKRPSKAR